eukprot:GHVS01024990.1.p1 GENE.GHVS01024990.1~~GHVS01024990.1.p1  ORF type:complete len:157 (+),score=32.01 GHVS01024990.1:138-608(+)
MASMASLCFLFIAICMFCQLPRYEAEPEVELTIATNGVIAAGDVEAIPKADEVDGSEESVKEVNDSVRILQTFEKIENDIDIEELSLAELQARVDAALSDAENQRLRGVSVPALVDGVLAEAFQGDGSLLNSGIKNEEAFDPITILKKLLKLLIPL